MLELYGVLNIGENAYISGMMIFMIRNYIKENINIIVGNVCWFMLQCVDLYKIQIS